jgi:hypothetical protein
VSVVYHCLLTRLGWTEGACQRVNATVYICTFLVISRVGSAIRRMMFISAHCLSFLEKDQRFAKGKENYVFWNSKGLNPMTALWDSRIVHAS